MGMYYETQYGAYCDKCKVDFNNAEMYGEGNALEGELEDEGWGKDGNTSVLLCPDCLNKKEEKNV